MKRYLVSLFIESALLVVCVTQRITPKKGFWKLGRQCDSIKVHTDCEQGRKPLLHMIKHVINGDCSGLVLDTIELR